MNSLIQLKTGILGSEADCEKLAQKKQAKILVISDSHGGRYTFRHIILQYGESCDALFFAGDGTGDLTACLDEAYKEKYFMKCIPPVIAFAKGNNDPSSYPVDFNPYDSDENAHKSFNVSVPKNVELIAAGRKILLTHGNEYGVYYSTDSLVFAAKERGADTVVFGHTHCPAEIRRDVYLMNPGSATCPRNLSKPGFAFIQIVEKEIYSVFYKMETFPTVKFVPYNPEVIYY